MLVCPERPLHAQARLPRSPFRRAPCCQRCQGVYVCVCVWQRSARVTAGNSVPVLSFTTSACLSPQMITRTPSEWHHLGHSEDYYVTSRGEARRVWPVTGRSPFDRPRLSSLPLRCTLVLHPRSRNVNPSFASHSVCLPHSAQHGHAQCGRRRPPPRALCAPQGVARVAPNRPAAASRRRH